jgi:amidase
MTGIDENDFTTSSNTLAVTDFTQFLNAESLADVKVGLPVWNDQAFEEYFASMAITDEEQQQNWRELFEQQNMRIRAQGDVLTAAGVTVVEFPITKISKGATDLNTRLEYGYKEAINTFLADLGADAPVGSLEEIIAFNDEDAANRAPYGQGHLAGSQETAVTAEEFASLSQQDNGLARNALDLIFQNYEVDVILSDVGQLYAPAGYPALNSDRNGSPCQVSQ